MANLVELKDSNFADTTSKGLTLVDFWAPWCGPCRMIAPVIEELSNDYAGKITVGKLNVDENQETAMKYRVMSIPTIILFKDGQPVDMIVGARRKDAFEEIINKQLNPA